MPGGTGSVNELAGRGLQPSVDGYVIDLDATFGEQFLDVAVGRTARSAGTSAPRPRSPHAGSGSQPVLRMTRPRVDHTFGLTAPRHSTNATAPTRSIPDWSIRQPQPCSACPASRACGNLRIRWIGHTLRAEVDVTVADDLTVNQAHDLAHHAEDRLLGRSGG
jgi:hypothetical protein